MVYEEDWEEEYDDTDYEEEEDWENDDDYDPWDEEEEEW